MAPRQHYAMVVKHVFVQVQCIPSILLLLI
jgi:hypothetical protein